MNCFGVLVLSLATFYLNQLFEKESAAVMAFRVATQRPRQLGQLAVMYSIPLFVLALTLFAWHFHAPNTPIDIATLIVLSITVIASVYVIQLHRSAFAATFARAQRRRARKSESSTDAKRLQRYFTKYF